jgi:N-acetylmuramoyl-L-alanine amidase
MKTQVSTTLTREGLLFRLGAAVLFLLVLLPVVAAASRVRHNDAWARQQFTKAERAREALNGRPVGERSRREYQRVIDSYRRVYFGSPSSSKADPSVVATAELMVEMGRRFDDNKILRGAVEQYRFLRKEYPGSKYRFDGLFTIGEIYKDDLNDPEEARTTFEDFLHRYPRNRLANDARAAVKEIDAEADEMEASAKAASNQRANSSGSAGEEGSVNVASMAASVRRKTLPRVTGVRHWSTPDYTRIAIDVEQEVKFGSQRISNPDRIFFDLRDTKLASTLVGKTFDVDDGFLRKIRVAEFQPGRTRIVLEVDELASYDAFLLPDPYRLIIDIHGKQKRSTLAARGSAGGGTVRSVPRSATTAAAAEDDSSETGPSGDARAEGLKTQSESYRESVAKTKPAPIETDLPAEDVSVDSKPANSDKPANSGGVIKTTVAVKGSKRRIPKTIVEADGGDRSTAAKTNEAADVAGADETKVAKLDSPAASSSSSVGRRKKSRSTGASADTADLRSGDLRSADLRSDNRVVTREARPTAAGDRSLIRALGLKIGKIVIDAGHGGHDTGTIGPNGLLEKDVVLDVAKRLGRLLESRLGAEVIYTRQDDTFIPLETRTAIANRERADLFISIHANSSRDSDARGVETYYLNFTSSPEALEVAGRENAVSEKSIYELQDLVKKIALKEKIEESREFAGDVQDSLYGGLSLKNAGIRNRGTKKAPFIVLIGANMPSILAEISFVSNPTDERKLESSEHRQRIAESLYRGVSKYASGLSGVKVASKIEKPEGQ